MPKRRRGSQADSRSDDTEVPPTIKRRRRAQFDWSDACQELYDLIRNYKSEDGHLCCETFIRVPKRRTAADYYDVVTQPIDLLKIQSKLKNDEYEDLENLSQDVELLITNAKAYYKKISPEYQDACELWDVFLERKNDLLNEGSAGTEVSGHDDEEENIDDDGDEDDGNNDVSESGPSPADEENIEELFGCVFTAKDGDRNISDPFQLLPPRSRYPEYYDMIKEPIDLKMIAMKIQDHQYNSVDEVEKDLLLMCRNARTFNEPGSLIYKDALTLKKLISSKRVDLEHRGMTKTSERIRFRAKKQGAQKLSAVCAALEYQSDSDVPDDLGQSVSHTEEDDDSGTESSMYEGDDGPLWALYNTVKNYKNSMGQTLSEPFMKLPSRRNYPDYYREIKRPLSMMNVSKKIRQGQYNDSLDDLVMDLDLVFYNARLYNADESRIFKDAVKLQKVMHLKKKDLEEKVDVKALIRMKFKYDEWKSAQREALEKQNNEMDEEDTSATQPGLSAMMTPRLPKTKGRSRGDGSAKKVSRKPGQELETLRKRLWLLYKTVHDYEENNRALIGIFMELPSKKDYPDYYQVISEPMDMSMIERKIVEDKYHSEQELISDFEVMFNNARHYNEEDSQVYRDAETLEKVLKKKVRSLSPLHADIVRGMARTMGRKMDGPKLKSLSNSTVETKLHHLYNSVKDYTDSRGRILSSPFMRLPTKNEYPSYYEIIKKPIDMQRISQRVSSRQYDNLDDIVADFVLMFDNACKFNEPDSQIYKDALALQRVCLEKKSELTEDDDCNEVPDAQSIVQELLINLFISVYNHQDNDGRCYIDSFGDLTEPPVPPTAEGQSENSPLAKLTFDQIKKNLDKGRYRRLDRFQEDMFEVFEHARNVSRTDSQLYEDVIELQMHFIKKRDELCKNGEVLSTPGLRFTEKHLNNDLEAEKFEKLPREQKEDEEKEGNDDREKAELHGEGESSVSFKEMTYSVGDFVYLEPRDNSLEPHIMHIEKLLKDPNTDELIVYGCWFYRPKETYHAATRKFLKKEVFKGDLYDSSPISKVLGKCYVMSVKDYFKMKPENFNDADVFVCESRYSTKLKSFKKIKNWSIAKNENISLLLRDTPLPIVRVASVFADNNNELAKTTVDNKETEILQIIDKIRENVPLRSQNEDGIIPYEQYGIFKLGDSVYVRSSNNRPFIARIDKLWTDKGDNAFFSGPYFIFPNDVDHPPTRLFYKKEVFQSSLETTTPLIAVICKCCVLAYRDYGTCRPTEFLERDVYVCESKYVEAEKLTRKLSKGLKAYELSVKCVEDEIYFFKKPITPKKEPSPLLMKASEDSYIQGDLMDFDGENTMDSEGQFGESYPLYAMCEPYSTPEPSSKPSTAKKGGVKSNKDKGDKEKKKKIHVPSGYIVFAGESRKTIQDENPDLNFGDISKIVGTKWRNLPKHEKERFEEKAKKIAIEQKEKQLEAERAFAEALAMYPGQTPASDYNHCQSPGSSQQPSTPSSQFQGYPINTQVGYPQIPYSIPPPPPYGQVAPLTHQSPYPTQYQAQMTPQHHVIKGNAPPMYQQSPQHQDDDCDGSSQPSTSTGGKKKKNKDPNRVRRDPSGFILYASEHRKMTYHENPEVNFGEISRIIGQKWRTLPDHVRDEYNFRAKKYQEERKEKEELLAQQLAAGQDYLNWAQQTASSSGGNSVPMPAFHYYNHNSQQNNGVMVGPARMTGVMMMPQSSVPPMQGIVVQRPLRFNTTIPPGGIPYNNAPAGSTPIHPMPPPRPPSPMFVSVPPKTQRLLHSEAYLKYIEGLSKDSKLVSDWDKNLTAIPESTPLNNNGKLPVQWLANGASNHGDTLNALWALRDLMLKDSLSVSRYTNIEDL
ncbi:protein polybromo-1-like isoform X2 [Tubulanus polymorphus]|uniref:protein polybromo-1-like isoform X2 n=1 Tax=Tubulanus polymorphus TaxID=672921 RepID=UPI003DA334F6